MNQELPPNADNQSLFHSTKWSLVIDKLPASTYFCQTVNLPGISLTEIPQSTPFVDLFRPGEKAIYDTFNITFLVDEDLKSWIQLHNWIRGLTFPTEFKEYLNLFKMSKMLMNKNLIRSKDHYSDAVLTLYTNKNNPNIRFKFYDLFPTTVSSIPLSVQDTAENVVVSDAIFRFSYYDIEYVS